MDSLLFILYKGELSRFSYIAEDRGIVAGKL